MRPFFRVPQDTVLPGTKKMQEIDIIKTAIPKMPILGQIKTSDFIKELYNIIIDEAQAVDFYTRLTEQAPNELHKEFISHAVRDEASHLQAFTKLYTHFTEQVPNYTIEPVQYSNYKQGIEMALKDELEAAELYKEMMLSISDQLVKDTFLFAMGDELEHAIQFSVLYGTL